MFKKLRDYFDLAKKAARYQTSEAFRKAAFNSSLNAIITINSDGTVIEWNAAAERIFGWTSQQAIGRDLDELIIPPEHRSAHKKGMRRFLRTGNSAIINRRVELEAVGISGNIFPVELSIAHFEIFDAVYFTASIRDISRRRSEEQHKKILLDELRYRVRTTLRIVRSVLQQVGRENGQPWQSRYAEALARMNSLIKTDELLVKTDWKDLDFKALCRTLVAVIRPEKQSNVIAVGESLLLPSHIGVLMGMIVHELLINSLRYGSLSDEHGYVSLRWDHREVDGVKCLWWQWREFGGPHIEQQPVELGYGIKMIEAAVPREIKGAVAVEWPQDGILVTITIPETEMALGD